VFLAIVGCAISLFTLNIYLALKYLDIYQIVADEPSYEWRELRELYVLLKLIYLLFMLICLLSFKFFLVQFIQGMQAFHDFLNNYRLTPKSRFIRKYKPHLEPLYEEMSQLEKSYKSSLYTMGQQPSVPQQDRITNSIISSLNNMNQIHYAGSDFDNDSDHAAHLRSSSQYMGRSSINFDERHNIFQEVEEHDDESRPEN